MCSVARYKVSLLIVNIDWMQDRNLLPKDWSKMVSAAQLKFDELRQRFPQSDPCTQQINDLLKEKSENVYQVVVDVMEIINKSTLGETNFINQYKNQLAQQWYVLLRLY